MRLSLQLVVPLPRSAITNSEELLIESTFKIQQSMSSLHPSKNREIWWVNQNRYLADSQELFGYGELAEGDVLLVFSATVSAEIECASAPKRKASRLHTFRMRKSRRACTSAPNVERRSVKCTPDIGFFPSTGFGVCFRAFTM